MIDDPDLTPEQVKRAITEMRKRLRERKVGSPEWFEIMGFSMELLLTFLISRLEVDDPELEKLDE